MVINRYGDNLNGHFNTNGFSEGISYYILPFKNACKSTPVKMPLIYFLEISLGSLFHLIPINAQRNGLAIFWTYSNNFHTKYAFTCKISLYFNKRTQIKNYPSRIRIQMFSRGSSKNRCPKCPKKRCLSDVIFDRRELLRQERYQQTNKNTPGEWSEIHDSGSAFANSKN